VLKQYRCLNSQNNLRHQSPQSPQLSHTIALVTFLVGPQHLALDDFNCGTDFSSKNTTAAPPKIFPKFNRPTTRPSASSSPPTPAASITHQRFKLRRIMVGLRLASRFTMAASSASDVSPDENLDAGLRRKLAKLVIDCNGFIARRVVAFIPRRSAQPACHLSLFLTGPL